MGKNGNGNGNGKKMATDVLNPNLKKYDLTDPANYEDDYYTGDYGNNIQKIYEMPAIIDMAGVFLRGRFKNERSLNAHLRLMYRHAKFNDDGHQELLRSKIAGSAAVNGIARLEALQAAVNLLAPDMLRTALGMSKIKKGEDDRILRGGERNSDFRNQERPPDGGLGNQRS